jgi:alpha-L-fucosidase
MNSPFTRRKFIRTSTLAAGAGCAVSSWLSRALAADASPAPSPASPFSIASGPFQPSWASLEQSYTLPAWYRDAKFGIWAHWGPQCQPRQGDWYAKFMYDQGRPQYNFHVAHYGHPSKFGFKDVINTWKAEKWDPATNIQRYKRAGAKFFVSMANHHDNMDMFDSKFQPWNSVNVGPKKDIVGTWAKLARAAGLPFGVSVHAARTWSWYEDAQGSDKTGPLAGVPYDGKLTKADGKGLWWEGLDRQDLYAQNHAIGAAPDAAYTAKFFNRVKDLLDSYHPDLLYFDDTELPLGDAGLNIAAHYFNSYPQWNNGKLDAVITSKWLSLAEQRAVVNDLERNMTVDRLQTPWQKDLCIGAWHYSNDRYAKGYRTPRSMINLLVDVVSKNGTFLLNIPLPGSGEIDDKAGAFLDEMAKWMGANSECIYGTRPWVVFGEGPSVKDDGTVRESALNPPRGIGPDYSAADIRFTKKGEILYAVALGWPAGGKLAIKALAANSPHYPGGITSVQSVATGADLQFTRDASGLAVTIPGAGPENYATALKITPKA